MTNTTKKKRMITKFTRQDILKFHPRADFMPYLLGRNIINNPNAYREDNPITGEVIFYDQHEER